MTEKADGKPLGRLLDIIQTPAIILLTVPAAIVIGFGLLGFICGLIDKAFPDLLTPWLSEPIDAQATQRFLQAIATSAMAALSLTYSLMLVVYTLAAGNIGPRLLKRFTTEPINQITSGILGGTFLFALVALLMSSDDKAPVVSAFVGLLLAIIAVLQLISFVRNVSRHVTIDDEIASIGANLEQALKERLLRNQDVGPISGVKGIPEDAEFESVLAAERSGYIGAIDFTALVKTAKSHDRLLRLECRPGDFVLDGEPILSASKSEEPMEGLAEYVVVEPARSVDRPVEFQTNLLLEIAMRALSPSVNDVFTAIAAVNQIISAIASVADTDVQAKVFLDENDEPRLITEGMELEVLVSRAFHPLRRAIGARILIAEALARGYARLFEAGGDDMKQLMTFHAELLIRQLHHEDHFKVDIDQVYDAMPRALRNRINTNANSG